MIDLRVGDASEPRIASNTPPVVRVAHRPNESGSANSAAESLSKDAAERADAIEASESDDSSQIIGTTSNHPFWSVDRREYVQAGKLELGERVLTYSGDTKRVLSKLARPGPQPVYNLEVFAEHVYYVGKDGVLVHNAYGQNGGSVLMLGEGNLSYARALVEAGEIDARRLVATVFEADFVDDFARSNASWLRKQGAQVLTGVDARNIRPAVQGAFDDIIFHFPHTGGNVQSNLSLLKGFFSSALESLVVNGNVHVTRSKNVFYNRWGKMLQADPSQYSLVGKTHFSASNYKTYRHMETRNPTSSATQHGTIYTFKTR